MVICASSGKSALELRFIGSEAKSENWVLGLRGQILGSNASLEGAAVRSGYVDHSLPKMFD